MKRYTAEISVTKKDQHSFLVALIPALSIPAEFKEDCNIMESDCAVIAANHGYDGNNQWAYVHLERDEKQTIGEALRDACVEMGKWYWCNLYSQGEDEVDDLRARHTALVEAAKPVAAWWRKERMVAEPPYQTEHVALGTDGPECVGVDELDALAALVGEG